MERVGDEVRAGGAPGRFRVGLLTGVLYLEIMLYVLAFGLWSVIEFLGPYGLRDTWGLYPYVCASLPWVFWLVWAGIDDAALERGSVQRLAWTVVAVPLAVLWPLQAGLMAGLHLRRYDGRRRTAVALGGAVLLLAGTPWGALAVGAELPWRRSDPSPSAVLGEWHGSRGELLEVRADGTFTETLQDPKPGDPASLTGRWELTFHQGSGNQRLHLGVGTSAGTRGYLDLEVYGALTPASLWTVFGDAVVFER
ncbi:hypothetical protein GCM10020229_54690 [Kitasatospora albolonga]